MIEATTAALADMTEDEFRSHRPTPGEIDALALRCQADPGDGESRRRLIATQRGYCYRLVRGWTGTIDGMRWAYDLDDLWQAAHMGILEALRLWEPGKSRFGTYAYWWVRRTIRFHGANLRGRIVTERQFSEAACLVRDDPEGAGADPRVAAVRAAGRFLSLDDDLQRGRGGAPERDHYTPEVRSARDVRASLAVERGDPIAEVDDRDQLEAILRRLPPREAEVVRLAEGLGGVAPMTMVEIGEAQGVSRERIRQVRDRAMKRIDQVAWLNHRKLTGI